MLETVREYAAERLRAMPEAEEVHQHHADAFRDPRKPPPRGFWNPAGMPGWTGSSKSTTTCERPCPGTANVAEPKKPCGWHRPCGAFGRCAATWPRRATRSSSCSTSMRPRSPPRTSWGPRGRRRDRLLAGRRRRRRALLPTMPCREPSRRQPGVDRAKPLLPRLRAPRPTRRLSRGPDHGRKGARPLPPYRGRPWDRRRAPPDRHPPGPTRRTRPRTGRR